MGLKVASKYPIDWIRAMLFQSPCGVMGLKDKVTGSKADVDTAKKFQSPCGVMGLKAL